MEISSVFFHGKLMKFAEVIPVLMRQMIEEDAPELPDFNPSKNPYEYMSERLSEMRGRHVSVSTIRNWCYERDKGGALPTVEDLLKVIKITKSHRPLLLIGSLIDEKDPEEQSDIYASIFEELGNFVKNMGDSIKAMAPKYRSNSKIKPNEN